MKMKFQLGQTVMTRGISEAAKEPQFSVEVFNAFNKYMNCDWGDTCEGDSEMNDAAVKYGKDRIVAKYKTSHGDIFIITEYDRSATTILFADEYWYIKWVFKKHFL